MSPYDWCGSRCGPPGRALSLKDLKKGTILRHRPIFFWMSVAVCWISVLFGCAPDSRLSGNNWAVTAVPPYDGTDAMAPSRRYAGEILSHMLRVVLGNAGDPDLRRAWNTRGLDVPLDLDAIASAMNGGHKDKSIYMVFDSNILGLSEVLYHYDRSLNLFKGKRVFDSIYPSVELIALRQLLLKKIHRGEKIRMEGLIRQKNLLLDIDMKVTGADLSATGLTSQELTLLRSVLHAEPSLFDYLEHPFILDTLYRDGFVEMDPVVQSAREKSGYRQFKLDCPNTQDIEPVIRIAILPSLIAQYRFDSSKGDLNRHGFAVTAAYRKAMADLQKKILERTEQMMRSRVDTPKEVKKPLDSKKNDHSEGKALKDRIFFAMQDQRPLVVLPDNASWVIGEICPGADFTVIILGKNVYRSIHFDQKMDIYPAVNRIYLDFLDVKYAQVADEIDQISHFILSKLDSGG